MRYLILLLMACALPAMAAKSPRSSCDETLSSNTVAPEADISKMSDELQLLWGQDFNLTGRSLFIIFPEMSARQIRALVRKAGATVAKISNDSTLRQTLVRTLGDRVSYAALSHIPEVQFMGLSFFMRRAHGEPFPAPFSKCSTDVYRWLQGGGRATMKVTLRTNLGTNEATIRRDFASVLGPRGTYTFKQGSLYEGPNVVTTVTRAQAEQIHGLTYVDSLAP
jgi:hypothetical protein